MKRRQFLQGVGAAAVSTVLPAGAMAASPVIAGRYLPSVHEEWWEQLLPLEECEYLIAGLLRCDHEGAQKLSWRFDHLLYLALNGDFWIRLGDTGTDTRINTRRYRTDISELTPLKLQQAMFNCVRDLIYGLRAFGPQMQWCAPPTGYICHEYFESLDLAAYVQCSIARG